MSDKGVAIRCDYGDVFYLVTYSKDSRTSVVVYNRDLFEMADGEPSN